MSKLVINQSTPIIHIAHPKINKHDLKIRAICTEVEKADGEKVKIYAKKALAITSKVVIEAIKITAVVAALAIFATYVTPSIFSIYIVVIAPLAEEIVFRGVIQNSISLAQAAYNKYIKKEPPTPKDLDDQRFYRIWSTAILFGAAHLQNPGQPILQAIYCTLIGHQLGELMERTHTLAWSILEHGINNAFVASIITYPLYSTPIMVGFIAVKLFNSYSINHGGLTVGGYIGEGACQLPHFCAKGAGQIIKKIKNRQPKHHPVAAAA